jgi:hypothetical protein
VSHCKGTTYNEGVQEYGAKDDILAFRRSNNKLEKTA